MGDGDPGRGLVRRQARARIESLAKAETDSIRGDIKHNSDDDTATRVRKLQQVHDYDDARAIVAALRMLVTP